MSDGDCRLSVGDGPLNGNWSSVGDRPLSDGDRWLSVGDGPLNGNRSVSHSNGSVGDGYRSSMGDSYRSSMGSSILVNYCVESVDSISSVVNSPGGAIRFNQRVGALQLKFY